MQSSSITRKDIVQALLAENPDALQHLVEMAADIYLKPGGPEYVRNEVKRMRKEEARARKHGEVAAEAAEPQPSHLECVEVLPAEVAA